jgi:hypothetical protein
VTSVAIRGGDDGPTRAAVLRLVVLLVLCLPASACGGLLGGEDNGPPPDPLAAPIREARAAATKAADEALEDAVSAVGGTVVARASEDDCYEGQNNYKVHDGYDHRCTIRRAVVAGFDGDFRERIRLLDRRLFAAGWGCYRDPCPETLSGNVDAYWDLRKQESGGGDPPISSLPTTSPYERGDQYLDVAYIGHDRGSRATLERFHRRMRGGLFTSYERARPFAVDAALERASRHEYVVAFAVETDYFEDTDVG